MLTSARTFRIGHAHVASFRSITDNTVGPRVALTTAGATMRLQSRNFFKASVICLAFFAASAAIAGGHKSLNGTWTLEPTKSEFAGEPALQTGSVSINDREHNITVTRNF